MKLGDFLTISARRAPFHPAVVFGSETVTYSALERTANRLANALEGLGLQHGDRIALMLPNSIALIEIMAAIFKTGGICVPVSVRLAPPEIKFIIENSAPFALVYTPEIRETVRDVVDQLPNMQFLVSGEARQGEKSLEDLVLNTADQKVKNVLTRSDDAVICYTSGTTGRPKGVVSTHRNLIISQGWLNAQEWGLKGTDRTLVATPMAHRTGIARVACAFCQASTLVVQERFDPGETVRLIEKEKATHIGLVPTIANMILVEIKKRPQACKSLRCMLATGEVFPVKLKEKLFSLLPDLELHSFYSQTEAGLVCNLRPEEQTRFPDSLGKPVKGVEVRIVNRELKDVKSGERGEILVRCGKPGSISLMREYFRQPGETKKVFPNNWLRTGDMAKANPEGYLYFVDRLKDMIVSGGLNVYSREVEEALLSHPDIKGAAVIGVPDKTFGEAVKAFVIPVKNTNPSPDNLIAHCKTRIGSYKKPKYIQLVDALPRNSVGKVAKHLLRN